MEHRIIVGGMNAFLIIGGAALLDGRSIRPFSFPLTVVLSGVLAAGVSTLLSMVIVRPLTDPEPWRFADYLYVFFMPSLLVFLATAYVLRLRTRNREFARALNEFQESARDSLDAPARSASGEPLRALVKDGGRVIAPDSIIYVSSSRKRSVAHTQDGDHEIALLLKDVLNRLPGNFIRVHKSYLVDLRRVERIEYRFGGAYQIALRDDDDTVLPVGRGYLPALRAALQAPDSSSVSIDA